MTKLRAGGAGPRAAAQVGSMLAEAMRCHQDGRTARAERLYRDIIAIDPNHLDAVHLTGVLAAQQRDYAKAAGFIERAARIAPHIAQIHANLGKAYYGLDRIEDARKALEEAVRLQPGLADAWNDLGNCQRDLGRLEQAMASFGQANRLSPALPEPWANAADLQIDLGEYERAQVSLAHALSLAPQFAEALAVRARCWLAQGRQQEALADADRVIALRPQMALAHALRGEALAQLARTAEARVAFDQALALDGKFVDKLMSKGLTAAGQWLRPAAIGYFQRALRFEEDNREALSLLAMEQMLLRRFDEAKASARRALTLDPDDGSAQYALTQVALQSCDWDGQSEALARMRSLLAEGKISTALSAFTFMSFDTTPAEQLACARLTAPATQAGPTLRSAARPRGKIRLAYLSGDFHGHATTWLMSGLVERHDRDRFEVIGLSNGPAVRDDMRQHLIGAFDRFVDIRELDDEAAAALIGELSPDVFIDLKGYTQGNRANLFARRLAPVQVSFLGYPGTMGADFMDYIVADRWVIPAGDEAFYAEKVVRLPDSYQVNTARPQSQQGFTRQAQGLPQEAFVFCAFNNTYKITREVFEAWMRLLAQTPGAVLWLLADNPDAVETLKREASARGIDATRLVFAERMGQGDHIARQELADLFLDTAPVSAHTTASDALWAGLPVVTTPGRAFIGRVAASVLSAADLSELIAQNLADYETLALALTRDRGRLDSIRQRLRHGRSASRLFDTARFTRHLERALETMHARAQAGEGPQGFDVTAEDG
ncbi:MAG TPA: tetratricopeptide repeat protein [Caulobacteraceae bacterium]|nr:tetratricopeptide repeat protein [Caulobacteraceae bacterium]